MQPATAPFASSSEKDVSSASQHKGDSSGGAVGAWTGPRGGRDVGEGRVMAGARRRWTGIFREGRLLGGRHSVHTRRLERLAADVAAHELTRASPPLLPKQLQKSTRGVWRGFGKDNPMHMHKSVVWSPLFFGCGLTVQRALCDACVRGV